MGKDKKTKECDRETVVLFEVFQLATISQGEDEMSPTEFLEKYSSSIRATCRVFELLGLAKPVQGRIIGWMPTKRLLSLVVEPSARPLKRATKRWAGYSDIAILELLLVAADASVYDRKSEAEFACNVLEQLGLLRKDNSDDWITTNRLAELVVEVRDAKLLTHCDQLPGMFGSQSRRP
jgi:hypothetical protein